MQSSARRFYTIILVGALSLVGRSFAASDTSDKTLFPYAFSNFPWWQDSELRSLLKRKIPGLGDEIQIGSPLEARIRTELHLLMRTKGISAEVQSSEPSSFEVHAERVPSAPPVSVVFSILAPPAVQYGIFEIQNSPEEVSSQLKEIASSLNGRPYSERMLWAPANGMKEVLAEAGYLSAEVALQPGAPEQTGDHYLVPVTVDVKSGPKYHIADIEADGGPLLAGRDLRSYFTAKKGDTAVPNPFGHIISGLKSIYWHAGYMDVSFMGEPVLNATRATAVYKLKVNPGPIYRLGMLKVNHLMPEQENRVRSLIEMKSGDVYDGIATSNLLQKLQNTDSGLKGFGFTFSPVEDKTLNIINLTLDFYH